MDTMARADLLERLRQLEQAALDFPHEDFARPCHHLIADVAAWLEASGDLYPDLLAELGRASVAAARHQPMVVGHILRAVIVVASGAAPVA